ncbi:hypothetical protein [Shewanella sp. cp20]|uniref:hypothetical protein n=1 Tax=Shewanella sp. cp20 TaxID=1521167 RepID=UPI000AD86AC0|nr:hypothetical protein [Shewanella sp. cp20]
MKLPRAGWQSDSQVGGLAMVEPLDYCFSRVALGIISGKSFDALACARHLVES